MLAYPRLLKPLLIDYCKECHTNLTAFCMAVFFRYIGEKKDDCHPQPKHKRPCLTRI